VTNLEHIWKTALLFQNTAPLKRKRLERVRLYLIQFIVFHEVFKEEY